MPHFILAIHCKILLGFMQSHFYLIRPPPAHRPPRLGSGLMNSIFAELWLRFSVRFRLGLVLGFGFGLSLGLGFFRFQKPQNPDKNASLALFLLALCCLLCVVAVDQNAIKIVRAPPGPKLPPSGGLLCLIVSGAPQNTIVCSRLVKISIGEDGELARFLGFLVFRFLAYYLW